MSARVGARAAVAFPVAILLATAAPGELARAPERFDVVIVDAGHGGEDHGARGASGLVEKDLVLDVAARLAERLRGQGLQVVLTRGEDVFVPLETRTSIANDARGDLFLSIHANAAGSAAPRGTETYFVSVEASDEAARRVAERENDAFAGSAAAKITGDPLLALLGDMMATEHARESAAFARLAERELARTRSPSRGVKQAPFVVLMGVQMPAALIEIGFVTNAAEERSLAEPSHRDALADALARAVRAFGKRYDAIHGGDGSPVTGGVR